MRKRSHVRRMAVALGTAVTLGVGLVTTFGPGASLASSHREAPLISADPQVDNTDVYAFVSPDKPGMVTIVSNWLPFEEPAGGPNFYSFAPGAHYDINIDNNGDAKPDITYEFAFANHYRSTSTFLYNTGVVNNISDPTLNFYQDYTLSRIQNGQTFQVLTGAPVAPSNVGEASMPNYSALSSQAISSFGQNGSKAFAGQADDPFFLDLRVFDLLYGLDFSEVGNDTLDDFNVQTIAMQVPMKSLALNKDPVGNPIIGIWSTASRQQTRVLNTDGSQSNSGPFIELSRLGMPLVNEVVIPVGDKDLWNASKPIDDGQFLPYVQDPEVPHLINAIYGLPIPDSDPNTPGIQRDDLIQVFLTGLPGLNEPPNVVASEMLRLNMSVPPCDPSRGCATYSRLGVIGGDLAGYPNGRRLADDTIDISLQVVEGCLLDNTCGPSNGLGDGVNANDSSFRSSFPYVALPHSGSSD